MRKFIYNNKPVSACYGCQACIQICPRTAISITHNDEGFLYPRINQDQCIDCSLCEQVCPTQEVNTEKIFNPMPKTVLASWSKDFNIRMHSTSSGMFFLLSRKFIQEGGIVYGVGYNNDLRAYHFRVTDIEGLDSLRGSKYMQSDINSTYIQVKNDLKNGLKVLYSGTPCQIAGLRLFLRQNYDNLFTIDLVCHGVPSPTFFQAHVNYLEQKYNKQIIDFKFRAKKNSGWRSYTKYVFQDQKSVYKLLGEDLYSHLFHSGCINRESCFTCEFSKAERVSDITLSDFWGGEKYSRELKRQRKYGFNMVMCNTIKGENLFKSISDEVESRIIPIEFAIKGDIRLQHSEARPNLRNNIYKLYKNKGYEYLVKTYSLKQSFIKKLIPNSFKNLIKEIQSHL